jgi:pimeloyl-ACP methyl ester carboxylesterase
MLLFLPGLICDARIYAPQTAAFAGSMAVEGYGLADSLADMARIALAQADRAGADQIDLFGHSMGGRVALEVFRLAPDRVRRLALVSTGVHPVSATEPASRAALQAIGHERGFAALVDEWLSPMVAPANRADPDIYGPLEAMCLDHSQAVFDAQIKALLGRPDVSGLLPQITCPTLVMTGEFDAWASPAQHETIAAAIGTATLEIVPGAGHMVQFEAPEAVNSAITRWLQQPAA